MWLYYFRLAYLSLLRTPIMSGLMILAVAIGISTCLTTLTIYSVVANNPLAHKNDSLAAVHVDAWDPGETHWFSNELPTQFTYQDAEALRRLDVADQYVAMFRASVLVKGSKTDSETRDETARVITRDFFSMFDVDFVYGAPWSQESDDQASRVAVINESVNQRLFDGENSVGRALLIDGDFYEVRGVVADNWRMSPKVYDLNNGAFINPEAIYLPFSNVETKRFEGEGNYQGWKDENFPTHQDFLASEIIWIQVFVGFHSEQNKRAFEGLLGNYINQQKERGRFERPLKYALSSPSQWLDINGVVKSDDILLVWLSLVFLLVCLLNTITLLLAKFLRKAPEAGVRRALGASRVSLFSQHIIEALAIALCGSLIGIMLAWFGLAGIRSIVSRYEEVAVMNTTTLLAALVFVLVASVISGAFPAWRISKTPPAKYLKTQ